VPSPAASRIPPGDVTNHDVLRYTFQKFCRWEDKRMQDIIQETSVTPVEARVWRLCTNFAPRDGDDVDLVIMAKALQYTPIQVREAMTHLQEIGLLHRVTTDAGVPVIVASHIEANRRAWPVGPS
jgi:hypothetical protein